MMMMMMMGADKTSLLGHDVVATWTDQRPEATLRLGMHRSEEPPGTRTSGPRQSEKQVRNEASCVCTAAWVFLSAARGKLGIPTAAGQ